MTPQVGEHVVLQNAGTNPASIGGWSIADAAGHGLVIPHGAAWPRARGRGPIPAEGSTVAAGTTRSGGRAVLGDTDELRLYDETGRLRQRFAYSA